MTQSRLFIGDSWESRLLADLQPLVDLTRYPRIHLAIMCEPYMSRVANRTKRVESRWSMNRCAPFGQISAGDVILFKLTGGPVQGFATIDRRWCIELEGPQHVRSIIGDHWSDLGVDDGFAALVEGKKYVTLARVLDYQALEAGHIRIGKTDKRGWVVVR